MGFIISRIVDFSIIPLFKKKCGIWIEISQVSLKSKIVDIFKRFLLKIKDLYNKTRGIIVFVFYTPQWNFPH